jgi:putative sigma-54 modulation protein
MKVDVKAVHFELGDATRDYVDKKMERIAYAKDMIVELHFTFTKEKDFKCEASIGFRWGVHSHHVAENYDLVAAIDKLIDMIEQKVIKEKEKVQAKQ